MALEIELKLLCETPFDLQDFLTQLESIANVSQAKKGDNNDCYLDTKDRCLARAGLSARLREKAGAKTLDIKSLPIRPELIMSREEYSLPLKPRQNVSRALKRWIERTWPLELEGQPTPLFLIKAKRQKFILQTSAYEAELSYDSVVALKPGETSGPSFRELECEFISGNPESFKYVCELISQNEQLTPSRLSKFQRASQLLGFETPRYAAPKPRFDALDTVDEVARKICLAQFQTMLGYEPGTRVGLDLEHLHKMRVSVRRLRNAMSIFSPCFDSRRLNSLKGHYKWLADILGLVRDLDVQMVHQQSWRGLLEAESHEGWGELDKTLNARWIKARKQLITALNSARYRKLRERSESLFSTNPRRRPGHPGLQPLAYHGAQMIQKRSKQFRRQAKLTRRLGTSDALHALRLIGKKLRYTIEFFRPILGKSVKAKVANLSEFQDHLGAFNDDCVALEFAKSLRDEAFALPAADARYLYVLGQLHGYMLKSTRSAQAECERALSELGAATITKELDRLADRMSSNAEKTLRKRARQGSRPRSAPNQRKAR